eukprot:TCONS_00065858-protein
MLIALRTAPSNSSANPVERIMSIVNIGLQGIGVMRQKMSDEFEKAVSKASSVKEVRETLKSDELRDEMKQSLAFPKELLNNQMKRLSLKDKDFQVFNPVNEASIDQLWEKCQEIDPDLQRNKTTKKDLKNLDSLKDFLKTHCKETHYAFQIKKCSSGDCTHCGPYLNEECKPLPFLPDPQLGANGHYKPFKDMYGKVTKDSRPSLNARPKNTRKKLNFSPSKQHAKNTDTMLQCEECDKWRLVFSKKKITKAQ